MNREIICGDFESFVGKLYEEIEKAAKDGTGIKCEISPKDCKKWADENISWIEIYGRNRI